LAHFYKARPLNQESWCAGAYEIIQVTPSDSRPDVMDALVTFQCGLENDQEGSINAWLTFVVQDNKLDYCYKMGYTVTGQPTSHFRACGVNEARTLQCAKAKIAFQAPLADILWTAATFQFNPT
jgi:hypothetical protein